MPLCSLEEALEDLTAGKFVIVVDDEGRENEGDLFLFRRARHPAGYFLHGDPRPGIGMRADDGRTPGRVADP